MKKKLPVAPHKSPDESNLPDINLSREAIFRNRTECSIQKANGLKMILELGKFQSELDQIERNLLAVPDGEKLEPLFIEIKKLLSYLEINKKLPNLDLDILSHNQNILLNTNREQTFYNLFEKIYNI